MSECVHHRIYEGTNGVDQMSNSVGICKKCGDVQVHSNSWERPTRKRNTGKGVMQDVPDLTISKKGTPWRR